MEQIIKEEFNTVIIRDKGNICPECGCLLMPDGGCMYCYCGFSLCP
jgi:hypothetical protein